MVATKAPHVEVQIPFQAQGSELRHGERLQVAGDRRLDHPGHLAKPSEHVRRAPCLPTMLAKVGAARRHRLDESLAEGGPALIRGFNPIQPQRLGHAVEVGPAGHLDELIRLPAETPPKRIPVQEGVEVVGKDQRVIYVPEDEASLSDHQPSCSLTRSLSTRTSE